MRAMVLIGARGSGKSSVAAHLGPAMGRRVIDLDAEALALSQRDTIKEVFAEDGAPYWRTLEAEALTAALTHAGALIDAGGGVGAIDPARDLLMQARQAQQAVVVWIQCSPEVMIARLMASPGDRPALQGQGTVADEAVAVAAARAEAYAAAADCIVDGDAPIAAVVQDIMQWWSAASSDATQ